MHDDVNTIPLFTHNLVICAKKGVANKQYIRDNNPEIYETIEIIHNIVNNITQERSDKNGDKSVH